MFRLLLLGSVLLLIGSCKVGIGVQKFPGGKIKDLRDGEFYGTIKIGKQLWMSENMRYTLEGSYLNPENPSREYGRLYTWEQAMKVCPEGWHLPSYEEWEELIDSLENSNGRIQDKLKSVSGWMDYDEKSRNGLNSSGFNIFPAGYYITDESSFSRLGKEAYLWSSTNKSKDYPLYLQLYYDYDIVSITEEEIKSQGFSCRCIKD